MPNMAVRAQGANPQARAAFSRQLKNLKGYEPVTVLAGDDGWNPVRTETGCWM